MKSRISIDLDEDNQPIIKVDYVYSEDVRDKMVKKFLETFAADSCWARFQYISEGVYGGTSKTAIIRPLEVKDFKENSKLMLQYFNEAYSEKQ